MKFLNHNSSDRGTGSENIVLEDQSLGSKLLVETLTEGLLLFVLEKRHAVQGWSYLRGVFADFSQKNFHWKRQDAID